MIASLVCKGEERRQKARDRGLNGIDYIEVLCPDQKQLCVHLFSKELERISSSNIRIDGGTRIRDIRAVSAKVLKREDPELEDCLRIKLNRSGDFSTYTLSIVESEDGDPTQRTLAGFDPFYASADFSFKICCDSDLDCRKVVPCPPEKADEPVIDYLNKDYAGFRQLILDRLALIMPDWTERHVSDIGIALVELLAYIGDHLSYWQDAVATEAYLGTARHRISVRRHARLLDYAMHDGCNARTFLCLRTSQDIFDALHPADMFFVTRCDSLDVPEGTVLTPDHLRGVPFPDYEIFEPMFGDPGTIPLYEAHNEIPFYNWENQVCCLPKGSTHATLKDGWAEERADPAQQSNSDNVGSKKGTLDVVAHTSEASAHGRRRLDQLKKGDLLIFEEVIGPGTGNPADANPANRQAVRLTSVERGVDPLNDQPIVEIAWAPEDALTFPLCLSARLPSPECSLVTDVSVARGNVVVVDHGRSTDADLGTVGAASSEGRCDCQGLTDVVNLPARFSAILPERPVTFREPPHADDPASEMLMQDARMALPQVKLNGTCISSTSATTLEGDLWLPVRDTLDSWEQDRVFVVEINDQGCGRIRFGDGEQGKMPEAGTSFSARFRVGNGTAGNVGPDTIRYLGLRNTRLSGMTVMARNPLPATGGTSAEPIEEVRLLAPHAYRRRLERAIAAEDYAEIAARNRKLQNAAAAMRWTGSWYEAQVAVDPVGVEGLTAELDKEIERYLHRFRRMGHDLEVIESEYVPLDLTLSVCVDGGFLRERVELELLERFSNRVLADGSHGFFHPDRLTFGGGIAVTSIMAEALAVPGVSCVVANIKRLGDPTKGISEGVLKLGAMEIAQLDNDPSFPEHGKITLVMGGGR